MILQLSWKNLRGCIFTFSYIATLKCIQTFQSALQTPTGSGKLSYNPKGSKIKIGRLNKENESIYYGCIYFKDNAGINVAFSEVNALKLEKINILESKTIQDINLRYICIFDYIKKQVQPWFISPENYSVFEEVYKYAEKTFDPHIFIAFQLCEAFFQIY